MHASLFLAAFDPMHEVPRMCGLCSAKPPVFSYELRTYDRKGELTESHGFCCAACGSSLVQKLERNEAQVWAQEEKALKAEDVDVSALHEQRLASFPPGS
jgi:hypothetical protein